MKILDRYIIGNFMFQFLLVLAGLVSIYLLVDFVERIDDFQEAGKPMDLALTYFLLKTPLIFHQISPVGILLAGVTSLGLMHRHLEVMSLNAAGISLARIILPLLAASLLATILAVVNAQWILPTSNMQTDEIWLKEVKNKVTGGILRNDLFYYKGEKGIYSFSSKTPGKQQLHGLSYTQWDADYKSSLYLQADTLIWTRNGWLAEKGRIVTTEEGGGLGIEVFTERKVELPEKPKDFFNPVILKDHLSLSALIRRGLAEKRLGESDTFIEMNRRLSLIFLGLPLLILALPVMLLLHRRFSWELTMTIPASCLLAFLAWAAWNGSQALSRAELMPSAPASWTIHLTMTVVGLLLIHRQNNL